MVKTLNRRYTAFWNPTVKFYPNGILQSRRSFTPPTRTINQEQSRRGDITSFSRHSALRLRKALLTLDLPENLNCKLVGITLTLPWSADCVDFDKVFEDYRACFHRFYVSFCRKFPNSAGIFRHELQVRKMPHCHIVFWLSDFDFHLHSRGRFSTIGKLKNLVFSLWSSAVLVGSLKQSYSVNLSGFCCRGVHVDVLHDHLGALRYVCDHTSKHKRSQLGYRGKQWGYIRKEFFIPLQPFEYTFQSDDDLICFSRHLRKVCRYRLFPSRKCKDVLKSQLSKSSSGKSVVFVDQKTIDRLCSALLEDKSICKTFDYVNYIINQLETSRGLARSLSLFSGSFPFIGSIGSTLSVRDLFLVMSLLVRYS